MQPKKRHTGRWIAAVIIILIAAGAAGSNDKKDNGSASNAASSSHSGGGGSSDSKAGGCGTKATDSCTPHVRMGGSVRVDALRWRVESVRRAHTLGDQQYGLGAKAAGTFIVLKLHVHSDKDESATLTDDSIKLEIRGNTYDADNDGSAAAIGAGEDPFFLDTIGPDADRSGTVVFDVPDSVLHRKIEVRFNELGFGSTHGYIALPLA